MPLTVATDLVKRFTSRGGQQHHENRDQADRDLPLADAQIGGHLPSAFTLVLPAQHQHGQAIEGETPDHAKRIGFTQRDHIAPAGDDGEKLHPCDQVHDPVAGAEFAMRLAEPVRKHAVLGDAHQHAGGTDDRGIDCAGKNEEADQHHEHAENNPQHLRSDHVHRHAGDQIVTVDRHPHRVRDQHHRQQRTQAGKQKAVNRNHDRGAFQVLELGVLDLAIDLGQRLFAAHGQHGMAEGHDDAEQPQRSGQLGVFQKAESVLAEVQRRRRGPRRQFGAQVEGRIDSPGQQDHHHHGGDLHHFERLVARLLDPFQVLPPVINGDDCGKSCRG